MTTIIMTTNFYEFYNSDQDSISDQNSIKKAPPTFDDTALRLVEELQEPNKVQAVKAVLFCLNNSGEIVIIALQFKEQVITFLVVIFISIFVEKLISEIDKQNSKKIFKKILSFLRQLKNYVSRVFWVTSFNLLLQLILKVCLIGFLFLKKSVENSFIFDILDGVYLARAIFICKLEALILPRSLESCFLAIIGFGRYFYLLLYKFIFKTIFSFFPQFISNIFALYVGIEISKKLNPSLDLVLAHWVDNLIDAHFLVLKFLLIIKVLPEWTDRNLKKTILLYTIFRYFIFAIVYFLLLPVISIMFIVFVLDSYRKFLWENIILVIN